MWWALSALASPLYPATVQTELELECLPPCTVCHETAVGGTGTATKPFGVELQERGLTGASATELLQSSLAAMESEGAPEIDALREGLDPNDSTEFCSVLTPTYGCFSHVPAGVPHIWPLALLVLWLRGRSAAAR